MSRTFEGGGDMRHHSKIIQGGLPLAPPGLYQCAEALLASLHAWRVGVRLRKVKHRLIQVTRASEVGGGAELDLDQPVGADALCQSQRVEQRPHVVFVAMKIVQHDQAIGQHQQSQVDGLRVLPGQYGQSHVDDVEGLGTGRRLDLRDKRPAYGHLVAIVSS